MSRLLRFLRSAAIELWLPALLLLAWWLVSIDSTSIYFPPLSSMLADGWVILTTRFESDILVSLTNFAYGFLVGVALGIGLGVPLGMSSRLHLWFSPLLEFLRALPAIALLPAFVLMFGIGPEAKVAIIAFAVVWPILLNTIDGVRGYDIELRDTVRTYHVRLVDRVFRVVLPATSPQILAGMRLAISLGIILIVASEYFASTHGIGFIELNAARRYQMSVMWGALFILAAMGYLANVLFRFIEEFLLRWHRGLRGVDL